MADFQIHMDEDGHVSVHDRDLLTAIQQRIREKPSPVDVFIFVHGWWVPQENARFDYARFETGFNAVLDSIPPDPNLRRPTSPMTIGVLWHATEEMRPGLAQDALLAIAYPIFKPIAEATGKQGVSELLQAVWQCGAEDRHLHIHVLGHSMGCRVVAQAVCSAMDASVPHARYQPAVPLSSYYPYLERLSVVLFQGAIDANALELNRQKFGLVGSTPPWPIQVLVTRSTEDGTLKGYPPDNNLPTDHGTTGDAIGRLGPTAATFNPPSAFSLQGAKVELPVDSNFTHQTVLARGEAFIVGDLSPLHQAGECGPDRDLLGGHHSDIYCPPVYRLLAGFLFRPPTAIEQQVSGQGGMATFVTQRAAPTSVGQEFPN